MTQYTTLRVRTSDLRYAIKQLNVPGGLHRDALKMLIGFSQAIDAGAVSEDREAA